MKDSPEWKLIWPKVCKKCTTAYDADEWERLPYEGLITATNVGFLADLERRSCKTCGIDLTQPTVSLTDVIKV